MKQQQIDVTKLSSEQLVQIYKQTELEMQAINNAVPVIQKSINACNNAIEAINQLKNQKVQGDVMLPVSESAYAFGKVEDVNNVLIAIGGGYMAELPSETAVKLYEGRISNRRGEMIKIRQTLGEHQLILDQIELELRMRQETIQAQQQQKVEA